MLAKGMGLFIIFLPLGPKEHRFLNLVHGSTWQLPLNYRVSKPPYGNSFNMTTRNVIFITLILFSLFGCSTPKVASTQSINKQAALDAADIDQTPESMISRAEKDLLNAKHENLEFFSPLHLKQAQDSLGRAKSYLANPPKEQPNASLSEAIAASTFIQKGLANKKDVMAYLKEGLAHKRILESLNTPSLYPEAFTQAMDDFSRLITLIEEGKPSDALAIQGPVRADMYTLEIDALIHKHLSQASQILAKADDIDADKYAPFSYLNAKHKIDSTENYIRTNYRDRSGIKKAGEKSLLLAKIAYQTSLESRNIVNMDNRETEQFVLNLVKRLDDLNALNSDITLVPQTIKASLLHIESQLSDDNTKTAKLLSENEALKAQTLTLISSIKKPLSKEESDIEGDEVSVLETFEPEDINDELELDAEEQGFDSIEFAEDSDF